MADFEVDLPPVPAFKPMGKPVFRSTQVMQENNMDRDLAKKHLRSHTKNQRYFTSVADVRASMSLSALSRNKQKLVASNQFAAGARAQQDIHDRQASNAAARQQQQYGGGGSGGNGNGKLVVDHEKYLAAVERLKNLMNDSATNEEFELVRRLHVRRPHPATPTSPACLPACATFAESRLPCRCVPVCLWSVFAKAISYRDQMDHLVKLREAFDASPSPATLESLNKIMIAV